MVVCYMSIKYDGFTKDVIDVQFKSVHPIHHDGSRRAILAVLKQFYINFQTEIRKTYMFGTQVADVLPFHLSQSFPEKVV